MVRIDKTSIVDSLLAGDLNENFILKAQLISEDRRSFRERKSYKLSSFDFDYAIPLRLFTEKDEIQITFVLNDENGSILKEFFLMIKCAELPLSFGHETPWYA